MKHSTHTRIFYFHKPIRLPFNRCDFCGLEDRHAEFLEWAPTLRMDLWKRISGNQIAKFMCGGCQRKKIGRPYIRRWDFKRPWYPFNLYPSDKRKKPYPF